MDQDFQQSLMVNELETLSSREQFLGKNFCYDFPMPLILAGLSLREFVYEFKYQALVLFKCVLLQPKVCQ